VILLLLPVALGGYVVDASVEAGVGFEQWNPEGTSYHGGGVALLDFDGDGDLDVYATGKDRPSLLVRNEGGFRFAIVPGAAGASLADSRSVGVAAGDVDSDGDPDLVVTGWTGARLLENVGGSFEEVTGAFAVDGVIPPHSTAVALGDPDRDGDLDVYVGHNTPYELLFEPGTGGTSELPEDACLANRFYENKGGLRFAERAGELGLDDEGCAMSAAWTDADGDGDADLLVDNDHGPKWRPEALFENLSDRGGLAFERVTSFDGLVKINGMGIAAGDYDRDGDLDYHLSNTHGNVLLQNQGGLLFADAARVAGVSGYDERGDAAVSWGDVFTDVDLDGDPDLAVVNGDEPWFLHWNQGDGTFVTDLGAFRPRNEAPGKFDAGLAAGDLDGDGDEDFVTHRVNFFEDRGGGRCLTFWRNEVADPGDRWLRVRLEGVSSAADGTGAWIEVISDRTWLQEVTGGGSYLSSSDRARTFGLGEASTAEVRVRWPSGVWDRVEDVPGGAQITIREGETGWEGPPAERPPREAWIGGGACGRGSAGLLVLLPWWRGRRLDKRRPWTKSRSSRSNPTR
jgi:hypothetical protein